MSRWKSESEYLGRYTYTGILNTVAGLFVIFLLMGLGASPFIANIGGYLVGLILGFFVSKKFVFRSEGHITSEGIRYLGAFLASLVLNLAVLQFALDLLHWNVNCAQFLSAVAYTSTMYLLSRWLVFRPGSNSLHPNK
jgi:putative flippase GtrA